MRADGSVTMFRRKYFLHLQALSLNEARNNQEAGGKQNSLQDERWLSKVIQLLATKSILNFRTKCMATVQGNLR